MISVFADSFYYYALLNREDEAHHAAVEFTNKFGGRIITSAWVLTELADGMARGSNRQLFISMTTEMRRDPNIKIVPATQKLFESGLELYRERRDKDWSLTDCISFVIMRRQKLTDALTGDHHFEQAGFSILLPTY